MIMARDPQRDPPRPSTVTLPGGSLMLDHTPGATAQGMACVLACGGPSLAEQVDELMGYPELHVVAVNNAATLLPCDYWVTMDHPGRFHPLLWTNQRLRKFCWSQHLHSPIRVRNQLGEWHRSDLTPAKCRRVLGYRVCDFWSPDRWLTMSEVYAGPRGRQSVILAALRLCYDIGFRFIGLVGCDWWMDQRRPYAFEQSKGRSQVEASNDLFRSTGEILRELRPRFEAAGLTVLNLTEGSRLDVFERVDLSDSLGRFRDIRSECGADIDETDGLYHGI